MAKIAFYREWRPQTFDEVVGQEQVVFPLRQSVVKGETGHAYLFTGTRGTGKTSLARIYAKAVNCLNPENGNPCNKCEICAGIDEGTLLDVIEMDAASHNSVENIRRLTDEVLFAPAFARYKVYIIDEAHMLSQGAFNALLKTLEEPPAHAIFILATTEPHRIPATIISRCQRYDFRRIPLTDVTARLRLIADSHKINVTDEALRTMAILAEGTLRDAISLLDQANTGVEGDITRDAVLDLAGLVDDRFLADLANALLSKRIDQLLDLVNLLSLSGRDLIQTTADLARYLRNVLICKISDDSSEMIQVTEQSLNNMLHLANLSDTKTLINLIQGLSSLLSELRWTPDLRTSLEIGLIRLLGDVPDSVLAKLHTGNAAGTVKSAAESKLPTTEKIVEGSASSEPMQASEEALEKSESDHSENISTEPMPSLGEAPEKSESDHSENISAEPMPASEEAPEKSESDHSEDMAGELESSAVLAHEQLITHWTNVLNELNELGNIEILIMARSSRVSYDGTDWYLDFDSSMNSQYERCSMPDATRLLCRLVSQEMQQPVKVIIRQNKDAANNSGATAEPEWLSRIRKVCQDTDVPLEVEE
jgi:DNA polymerase III subunit gamma/tau